MKPITSSVVLLLFFELLSISTINFSFCNGSTYVGCIESERQALLKFKQDLDEDPSNRLASWTSDGDCCTWDGVICDNFTGHVLRLMLGNPHPHSIYNNTDHLRYRFRGKLNPSLLDLKHLIYLDLHENDFEGIQIPTFLGLMGSLRYLILSGNNFTGPIPDVLGNLTSLEYIDLSYNNIEGRIPRSFGRLCNLSSISMQYVKLRQEISEVLDIFSVCVSDGLVSLDLNSCQFFGQLTNQIGQFKNLDSLNLRDNSISGPIPSSLGELSSLRVLDLTDNKLNGTLTEIHFSNLTRLSMFEVSGNSLMFKVGPDWFPPFQLFSLSLGSCQLGPQLPSWLYTQKELAYLDLSNSGIAGIISNRFWKFLFQFEYINLSQNQLYGEIPNLTEAVLIKSLDLSSNNFSGSLPLVSSNLLEFSLFNNSLSGSIHQFLCHGMKNLQILNLGRNSLSGEVPDCWMRFSKYLSVINLGNNKFSGSLPNSLGTVTSLKSLNLRINNFSGTIPVSLQNCETLVALDVGKNEFVGNIPTWIGERFSGMMILNLRSNKFQGPFPKELCRLTSLQILDLAHNNLFGTVPKCINNFSSMVTLQYSKLNFISYASFSAAKFIEEALLVMKGNVLRYNANLNLLRSMDLSVNNFSGAIPIEVTDLEALRSLNLSYNNFIGRIPEGIGSLTTLESIDFSVNQLSGEIPQGFSKLSFLSYLNLSMNKLTGKIPSSTQLQSFDESSFMGNRLCGPPLPECPGPPDDKNGRGNDGYEVDWFYVSMALGFVVGFCSFIGSLIVNRKWRYRYGHFLDRLTDKFGSVVGKYF
ncbi:hypothetical protein Ddye_027434 [Dipteronia dyeriana]|uniref:Leucine-rich repeat-containing N-terminal plant-type domain-containing protein n=1 Tax=Dipteronia dyeriana TaxID=168575 RepID=A0AAD9TP22_9ROSI|nr:hypothetical protein Ddye_027434 [Dipteronia dyeriana]